MITPHKCERAAQNFLEQLSSSLHHLPPQFRTQKALAMAAGVSNPTISDYKNGNKLERPEFKVVFCVAYALLGRSPCTLNYEPQEVGFHKILNAIKVDSKSLLLKLSDIILNAPPEHQALHFIKSAIDIGHDQIISPAV